MSSWPFSSAPTVEDGSRTILLPVLPFGVIGQSLHRGLFPPTQLFQEKLFLKKVSSLGNKRFALRLIVEGVSTSFLGIAHKDALIRLGFKFVRLYFPNISLTTPNLQVRQLRFRAMPFFKWCCLYGFGWRPIKNVSDSF